MRKSLNNNTKYETNNYDGVNVNLCKKNIILKMSKNKSAIVFTYS